MATIDGIEIQHPCSASWAAMEGDDRSRFCRLCSKVVYDTTALATCELEKMLEAPTPPCLRVHRDRSGRVLTRDRLAALAFVGLAACTGAPIDTADTGGAGGNADGVAQIDGTGTHATRPMGTAPAKGGGRASGGGSGAAGAGASGAGASGAGSTEAGVPEARGLGERAGEQLAGVRAAALRAIAELAAPPTTGEPMPLIGEIGARPPPPEMGRIASPPDHTIEIGDVGPAVMGAPMPVEMGKPAAE